MIRGHLGPVGQCDRKHDGGNASTEHRDDDDAEQQVGECVDGVGAAHDEPVHPAADQSGRSADGDADHRGEQRAGECDQK